MDDIVAVKARDNSGAWFGFMTWGRIGDAIDDVWLHSAVRAFARTCQIGDIVELVTCDSLREAADCKYFYEGLFSFAIKGIPFGPPYEDWKKQRIRELEQGQLEIYFLGRTEP